MITLPFKRSVLPVPGFPPSSGFSSPVVFYLRHENDAEFVLPAVGILRPDVAEVEYFDLYSSSNRKALAELPGNPFSIGGIRLFDPHWTVRLDDGSMLVFFQRRRYFFRIFPELGTFEALFPEDVGLPSEVDEFWATNFKNDDGSITFLVHVSYENRKGYAVYRSDREFRSFKTIHSGHTRSGNIPHVLVPYRDGFLLSDFYYNDFYFARDPARTRLSEEALLNTVYRRFLKRYLKSEALPSDEQFRTFVRNGPKGIVPVGGFAEYMKECYESSGCLRFKEYCDTTPYRFEAFPWEVTYVDSEWRESAFETTFSNPAHFEIDPESGDAYVSSHNFNYLNRNVLEYFGPAAIDRFIWENGGFVKKATFTRPDGYRFTSHRIVSSPGGKRLVTFWQPNRLFSVSVPDLEGFVTADFLPNRLDECVSDTDAMSRYLRRDGDDESSVLKGLEVSTDGSWKGIAAWSDSFFLFDVGENRIRFDRIGIPFPDSADGENGKSVFVSRTTHCNYL